MKNHHWTMGKIVLIGIIILCLILSIIFSVKSVTGYIIAEEKGSIKNMFSLVFLLIGIFSTLFYLTKFR